MINREYVFKMGGKNRIIEIDETKVGHRKFKRGRIVTGEWVVGFIQRDNNEFRCFQVPKRDEAMLLKLIIENIAEGSTIYIYTDAWKAYANKTNFMDPDRGTNTQKIQSQWRAMK